MVKYLLQKFVEYNKVLNERDITYSTPLDLACIQGFDRINNQVDLKGKKINNHACSYRFYIVKILLSPIKEPSLNINAKPRLLNGKLIDEGKENGDKPKIRKQHFTLTYKELRKGANSPLHWAIYWADYDLAHLLIKENPMLLFWTNKKE